MSKKIIIFDLDDTLILEEEYIKSGFREVATELSKKHNFSKESIFKKMIELFKEDSNMLFNRLLETFDMQYTKEDITNLVKIYREHKPKIHLLPDAKNILNYLHEKNYRMGIITDGYKETQRKKLEVLNISSYFEHIIINDELGKEFWKPHSKSYELMKENFLSEYSNMVYIGDNLKKDFITPKNLGMKTIHIKRKEGIYNNVELPKEYQSEKIITNLNQLRNYF